MRSPSQTTPVFGTPDLVQLQILDGQGCLTDGALCFIDEMLDEQRAVVERHLAICPVCSHQQSEMKRATQLLRRARPRAPISADVRLVSRQALLRGAVRSRRVAVRTTPEQRKRRFWRRLRQRYLLAGALVALLTLGTLALLVLR